MESVLPLYPLFQHRTSRNRYPLRNEIGEGQELAERLARRARGFALASPAWRLLLPQVLSENSGTLLRNLPGPPRVLSDVMSRLERMPHEGALVFFGRGPCSCKGSVPN